jgi:hypothetical protein
MTQNTMMRIIVVVFIVRILTKLQFDRTHKISRKSNMGLYTRGGLIRCKSLLSVFIFLVFLFSIVIFMLCRYTWNIEPQTRTIYELIKIQAWMVACSASPYSIMFFLDHASSNLFFFSMSKSHWLSLLFCLLCPTSFFALLANCYWISFSLSLIVISFLETFYSRAIK